MLGRLLAREHPADADVVVPVPDSGVPAAVGYALESGLPFRMGLIRNHYIGRTFIEPEQSIRDFGVKLKLNPVRTLLEGKRVVLVDDSIVRGTTSRKIVRMVREAGATEVHVRISCPPTVSPCYYGIDTPTREELLAADASRIRPRLSRGIEAFEAARSRSARPRRTLVRDSPVLSAPIRSAISRSKACAAPSAIRAAASAPPATPASIRETCSSKWRARIRARRSPKSRQSWKFRRRRMNAEETLPVAAPEQNRTSAAHPARTVLLALGGRWRSCDHRHDGAGARDSLRLDGKYAAGRRPSADEPHRLRRQLPFTQLPRAPLARAAPPAGDHFSRADSRHDEDFIKRLIGMPGDTRRNPRGRGLHQRQAARRALPQRPAQPDRQLRPGDHSRAQLFRPGR